jgi:hypothetical protein
LASFLSFSGHFHQSGAKGHFDKSLQATGPLPRQQIPIIQPLQATLIFSQAQIQLSTFLFSTVSLMQLLLHRCQPNTTFTTNLTTRFSDTSLTHKARTWPAFGTRATSMRVIVTSKRWIIALLIASAALVAASLASPLLRFATHGPDILMNASSLLAKNNPCIPTPEMEPTWMRPNARSY